MKYIKQFAEITMNDSASVGGKIASLGEMIRNLTPHGIRVPDGFAITIEAYRLYLAYNHLIDPIKKIIETIDITDLQTVSKGASRIRELIVQAHMPSELATEITEAYRELSSRYGPEHAIDVAVRSSAAEEDLPGASFAGQQESFLRIQGNEPLLLACKQCFASLFTDRAIIYRATKGFDHFDVGIAVGVQKMVRSDSAVSGVAFSLDTETGFKDLIVINASYGLGQAVVQGVVNPDEFRVFKPTLQRGFDPVIKKICGTKKKKLVYGTRGANEVVWVDVSEKESQQFCLTHQEIVVLAGSVARIEDHYSQLYKRWCPMDVEWAKDGIDGTFYIVQARPETVHALRQSSAILETYVLKVPEQERLDKILLEGQSIGTKIAAGMVRIVHSPKEVHDFAVGDILVTTATDPDWLPIMRKAAGIITQEGGRTCHAAIVSRELGIPAVIGSSNALTIVSPGRWVTLDCSQGTQGYVYAGKLAFEIERVDIRRIHEPAVPLLINVADPDTALSASQLPAVSGVGLARVEFIIAHTIKAHPMAFVESSVLGEDLMRTMSALTGAYPSKQDFFIELLAQGIGTIAAAFWPREVVVRFSDFKTNEYRELLGGSVFEPHENNPMLGLRGASRYYNPRYEAAFLLECAAIKKVRDSMGLTNVIGMIPFIRTVQEAHKVLAIMKKQELIRGMNGLKIFMMIEIPSNVLLIDDFCNLFDGFSIGSNDLTQMILAVDRDSSDLAPLFDERDQAVKKMCALAIEGALRHNKPIGICGQAPSDFPDFAEFLIEHKISSLSLNTDAVLHFLMHTSN